MVQWLYVQWTYGSAVRLSSYYTLRSIWRQPCVCVWLSVSEWVSVYSLPRDFWYMDFIPICSTSFSNNTPLFLKRNLQSVSRIIRSRSCSNRQATIFLIIPTTRQHIGVNGFAVAQAVVEMCTILSSNFSYSMLFKWLRPQKNKVTKLFKSTSHYFSDNPYYVANTLV